jgi:hypothetical protein
MSKAILIPMLLLRNPRLWEQHQAMLLTASESRMTLGAVEALTGMDLGGNDRAELATRLSILIAHLLKWEFQAEERGERWRSVIQAQRVRIAMLIMRRASLARYTSCILAERYRAARVAAMTDTGLGEAAFPEDCPYRSVQILDSGYLPEAA